MLGHTCVCECTCEGIIVDVCEGIIVDVCEGIIVDVCEGCVCVFEGTRVSL